MIPNLSHLSPLTLTYHLSPPTSTLPPINVSIRTLIYSSTFHVTRLSPKLHASSAAVALSNLSPLSCMVYGVCTKSRKQGMLLVALCCCCCVVVDHFDGCCCPISDIGYLSLPS
ncbi:hypothetical protein K474DRAFT_1345585 [Panus rudis PR-1116 ss-1]|nr:hypothetical protein K474DRAFT_1345585 [Panus rudis PR-1116 ss-1]